MQIEKTLDVTPEEFFGAIETSILYDVEEATGKRITRKRINGFHYTKATREPGRDQGSQVKVKIKSYRYPTLYEVKFTYATGANIMRYAVEPTADGAGSTLSYTEEYTANVSTKGITGWFNLFMYERRIKARANKTIKQIVKYAHDHRTPANNPLLDELRAMDAEEAEGATGAGDGASAADVADAQGVSAPAATVSEKTPASATSEKDA